MNRYRYTKLIKDPNGIRYRSVTEYPQIFQSDSDIIYYTKEGDSYSNLAYKHYGDVSLWWIIASANNSKTDSLAVEQGIQLRIPASPSKAIDLYNEVNEKR